VPAIVRSRATRAEIAAVLQHIVVVGASLAGLRAAETLRADGYAGRLTMIGAERHLPYDRPPLTKKLLAGEWEPDRIALRKPDDVDGLGVEWRLGERATALDTDLRTVTLAGGNAVAYDGLVIATGAAPRRFPGEHSHPNVLEVRTVDDALALRTLLVRGGASVVVIGAGFIGLEVAATARRLGNEVVVLEGLDAPLVRGLGAEMGRAVAAIHADAGVEVRCGVRVEAIDAGGVHTVEGVEGTATGDGTRRLVDADIVVVGIGVAPVTGWLDGSGLTVRDGVVCDAALWTGAPGVVAAGDVVRWFNPLFDEEMRVEHWTNAAEQGAAAARTLLALDRGETPEPYAPVPFFWSDQYDHRIQFLGRCGPDDEVVVVAGSPDERKFLALYGRAERLRGVLGLDVPRLVMPYRKLLLAAASMEDAIRHAQAATL
jgi:NADPH-dependent 2,4-dienoyl-CoA reductase/sulfur reductase-like enzyme